MSTVTSVTEPVTSPEAVTIEKKKWNERRKIIRAFALTEAGINRNGINSQKYADSVVDSVRLGCLPAPEGDEESLLAFMREQCALRIAKKLDSITVEVPKKSRRVRSKGKRKAAPITMSMSVDDVIRHLPQIALLISRLNDVLNPSSTEGGAS